MIRFFLLFLVGNYCSSLVGQVYLPGHQTVEYTADSIPGFSIKNFASDNLRGFSLFNDQNRSLDLAIGGSQTLFFGDVGVLSSSPGVPLLFNIAGNAPMFIDTDGQVGITGPSSLNTQILRIRSLSTSPAQILSGIDVDIAPLGIEQASGIGGQFRGGWRGVRGLSRVGVGVEGFSNSNNGVFGTSNQSVGILGTSTNEQGVRGESLGVGKAGVYGISVSGVGVGVRGESTLLSGVIGSSEDGPGVTGTSTKHHGIIGSSDASQTSGKFDFYATGTAMDYGASSSRRWKTDITPIADALELVSQMRGVRYTWDEEHGAGRRDIGFIAEEVGEVFPEIVAYDPNGIDADALDYTKIPAVLVQAINELHAKHQQEISELRSEIQLLKELVQSSNAAADSASLRPTMQPNKSK